MLLVVPERQGCVARQLGLGPVPDLLVDQRRHRDGDPLLPRSDDAIPHARVAGLAAARFAGRPVLITIGVGGSGIDRIGQDVVDRRGRPWPPATAWEPWPEVQPAEDLTQGQGLLGKPAVEHPHDLGLGLIDDELASGPLMARQIAVAVRRPSADELAGPGLLQLAAPKPLAQQSALVFGDSSLDLEQELVSRIIGDGAVEKLHRAPCSPEFLEQQHLIGIAAGQPVGGENADDINLPVANGIAQGVQPRSVETRAAVAFVPKHMEVAQVVVGGSSPASQPIELAVDGLLALLAFGGDTGIDGGAHGAPPSVIG